MQNRFLTLTLHRRCRGPDATSRPNPTALSSATYYQPLTPSFISSLESPNSPVNVLPKFFPFRFPIRCIYCLMITCKPHCPSTSTLEANAFQSRSAAFRSSSLNKTESIVRQHHDRLPRTCERPSDTSSNRRPLLCNRSRNRAAGAKCNIQTLEV